MNFMVKKIKAKHKQNYNNAQILFNYEKYDEDLFLLYEHRKQSTFLKYVITSFPN